MWAKFQRISFNASIRLITTSQIAYQPHQAIMNSFLSTGSIFSNKDQNSVNMNILIHQTSTPKNTYFSMFADQPNFADTSTQGDEVFRLETWTFATFSPRLLDNQSHKPWYSFSTSSPFTLSSPPARREPRDVTILNTFSKRHDKWLNWQF